MPLSVANRVFEELDTAQHTDREKDGYEGGWYDKTAFRIDFTLNGQPDNYEGRQDFGDGDGSLIQHIQSYHEYYVKDENWKNFVLHNKGCLLYTSHFYLDEIEHDPYVLISILSALHDGVFTLAEVQGKLEMLFEKQYVLTETVTMQIRYRTKMMVIIGPYGVPQVITYQEPYEYYICTVKLKNKDLSHLPVEVLTEEQLSAYSLYMRTLGNRPDLFGKAQYPNASTIKQPTYYDIPPEALKDDKFAAMMEEATKYIGYPYVWGGSSPSTSFDCSGYISWVLNHSGWNVGRQTEMCIRDRLYEGNRHYLQNQRCGHTVGVIR